MKRIFDLFFVFFGFFIFFIPMVIIYILVLITSKGPVIYWSDRIGYNNKKFRMPKFRSMHINAPEVATHLLKNPDKFYTPIGKFLRYYNLDELPQLWSILIGDMSFVGPRPALFNQYHLIKLRKKYGVDKLMPGLTGWSQVNGRDKLSIKQKVSFDFEYKLNCTILFDIKVLFLTLFMFFKKETK